MKRDASETADGAEVDGSGMLGIGALSVASGIPVNTLRTWERRYGFPAPARTAGGHRLYAPAMLEHLKLIATALQQGMRPSQVLALPVDALRGLLRDVKSVQSSRRASTAQELAVAGVEHWVQAAMRLDDLALESAFQVDFARLGLIPFLEQKVTPFLMAMGNGWERGEIHPFQEHFASQRLRDFLSHVWRPLQRSAAGAPSVVCAGMEGEQHELGLMMATCVVALAGWQVVYLGPNTPTLDIAAAAIQAQAAGVMVAMVRGQEEEGRACLTQLRAALPADAHLIAGGGGAPMAHDGVICFHALHTLDAWARENL